MTKSVSNPITLLSAQAVAAASSGTKGNPGAAGGWTDVSAYDGGSVSLMVQNAASGPTLPGNILIQHSPDGGTTITDVQGFSGDSQNFSSSTLAGQTSGTFKIDPGMKSIRVIGWGHSVNPVSYTAIFTGTVRS